MCTPRVCGQVCTSAAASACSVHVQCHWGCACSFGMCVCACAHGFICPHRLYVWVCMCALEGGCLCQCRQHNPGAVSREAAVVGDRPPPALRAAPRPLPAASPTQALRHRRTGRRRISSHRFTRGVAAAGRGPKVQVLEILAALKGPQVQAEVLCTVILLQASGGGRRALTEGSRGPCLPPPAKPGLSALLIGGRVEWERVSQHSASPGSLRPYSPKERLEVWAAGPDLNHSPLPLFRPYSLQSGVWNI